MFFLLFSDGKDVMGINNRDIGQRIRKVRIDHEMKQKELAELLGVTLNHISHVESGIKPASLDLLADIAVFLNVSLDYIVLGR
ncbi:MAG: helix-turn-helix domain-containing protein [Lachnospiraceae bacterium]|nr:helix-turn-helix domain-containing protein [Lachnospiraceae bacterium]